MTKDLPADTSYKGFKKSIPRIFCSDFAFGPLPWAIRKNKSSQKLQNWKDNTFFEKLKGDDQA